MEPQLILPFRVRADFGVIAITTHLYVTDLQNWNHTITVLCQTLDTISLFFFASKGVYSSAEDTLSIL